MTISRLTAVVIATATVVAAGVARGQEAPPTKIGFVDVEKAVYTIAEGRARLKELQDWARPRQQELQRLGEEITSLQQEISSKRGVASEEALAEVNRRLVAKQREFEDRQREARRDFEQRQDTILKDIGEKMNAVIAEYADANRFTAIFILKPNDVAYLANSADITDTVVALYDQKHPYPATPAGGS